MSNKNIYKKFIFIFFLFIIYNFTTCNVLAIVDPYQHISATVRLNSKLGTQENDFINIRRQRAKKAYEHLLQTSLKDHEVPTIAFCFSGGGYRAMIETIGWLCGADAIGLLDAAMYVGGLSGSTWALAPWVLSGLTIKQYRAQLIPKINRYFLSYLLGLNKDERQAIYNLKERKSAQEQPFGLVDLYGALLANTLLDGIILGSDKQAVYLTDLIPNLTGGSYPLPICTAVAGGVGNHHLWFEFTPFEIGSVQTGFIPTYAFGRKFNTKGLSVEMEPGRYACQQSLGYYMGIWGSAFAVDGQRLQHELRDLSILPVLQSIKSYAHLFENHVSENKYLNRDHILYIMNKMWPDTNQSFAAANMTNFTHNMEYTGWWNWWKGKKDIPMSEQQNFSLIDGAFDLVDGYAMNLSIVPLLRSERGVDVIIICDSSADLFGAPALRAAELRAKSLGLKFPPIDYTGIDQRMISMFEDKSANKTPIIVYMPGIKNPGYGSFDPLSVSYTATTNFCYTPDQVNELSGLTEFTMREHKDLMIQIIEHAINKKKKKFFWWS